MNLTNNFNSAFGNWIQCNFVSGLLLIYRCLTSFPYSSCCMVLYPLIIIKLKQQRIPGNVISIQAVIRRKRQNYRMTMMFIVITVAFLLCWGPYIIRLLLVYVIEHNLDSCIFIYFSFIAIITPYVFHAINPVIYFIFLSSFRQGFKNIFRFSRCNRTTLQASADNFELNNIPQGLHNN